MIKGHLKRFVLNWNIDQIQSLWLTKFLVYQSKSNQETSSYCYCDVPQINFSTKYYKHVQYMVVGVSELYWQEEITFPKKRNGLSVVWWVFNELGMMFPWHWVWCFSRRCWNCQSLTWSSQWPAFCWLISSGVWWFTTWVTVAAGI